MLGTTEVNCISPVYLTELSVACQRVPTILQREYNVNEIPTAVLSKR